MVGEDKPSVPLQWLIGWPQFDADRSVVARVSGVLLSCLQPATLHQFFMYKDVIQPVPPCNAGDVLFFFFFDAL